MNYQEFKKTYKWTLKNYPGADSMCNYSELIRLETVKYERPRRGSRWIETERRIELVNNEFYMNSVDAVPFFRNLGGFERVELNYTRAGYLPTFINSINPDSTKKVTRRFIFA